MRKLVHNVTPAMVVLLGGVPVGRAELGGIRSARR
jgi:hypothetical protein